MAEWIEWGPNPYFLPFTYGLHRGETHSRIRLGFMVRDHYLRWFATENIKHFEAAVPLITRLVGCLWRKMFRWSLAYDFDVLDPAAYSIILRFYKMTLPVDGYSLPSFMDVMARRQITREYNRAWVPEGDGRVVRTYSLRPFATASDVENRIFIEDLKELMFLRLATYPRLTHEEGLACCYIGECLMDGKLVSHRVLQDKYGIPKDRQRTYVDIAKVVMRKELYAVRKAIPHLYGSEEVPFINMFELTDEEKEDEEDGSEGPEVY